MKFPSLLFLMFAGAFAAAQSGLWVEVPAVRTPASTAARTDAAVKDFASRTAALTKANRERLIMAGRFRSTIPFSLPTTVHLAVAGRVLKPVKRAPGPITLAFDAAGLRAFPVDYRAHLEAVFASAQGTLNVVFGQPASGGTVLVKNFDSDIGDRDAVAGGYFMPNNGSGQPEIRFPVYTSPEAAAVNFVHCLLLAYIGPNAYGFDAFQEGLVRAAAMKIARTAGALPASLDPNQIDAVLVNTYDVGSFYDWYNQRALGGRRFIAPNLLSAPLPTGGSLGGIYLLRYQMSGSAWQKLVAENPGFLAEFNRQAYASPGSASDFGQLVAIGQSALNVVKGAVGSKIENLSFADWVQRQFILEVKDTMGAKVLVQPSPIASGLAGSDFGVFDVAATYFETQVGGNEVLLSGTAYPIFWDRAFDRIFPSAQEDTMPIAGAYGSVAPNLPNLYAGQPYRCTVDIPVGDRVARAFLPAGAIATATNPTPNNFYGTVTGYPAGATVRVRAIIGTSQVADALVQNGAFKANVASTSFQGYARMRIDVVRTDGSTQMLLQRHVNKGPGEIALDLRVGGDITYTLPGGLLKGIQMIGLPIDPYPSTAGDLLGIAEANVLLARYNSTRAAYDLYPSMGAVQGGFGFFARMNASGSFTVKGRAQPGLAVAVPCKPGWNLITCPLNETVPTSRVQVVTKFNSPSTFVDAQGIDIGAEFFQFVRGANDGATGAPETGTMVAATQFEPGKAYYVRVLAPEGTTLAFFPSSSPAKPGTPFPQTGWRIAASLSASNATSKIVIGQSNTATRNVDRKEDALLPPMTYGFQIMVETTQPLYKDVRRFGYSDRYKVRIDGLVKGREYWLNLEKQTSFAPFISVYDPANNVFTTRALPSTYRFKASGPTHRLELSVNGSSQ